MFKIVFYETPMGNRPAADFLNSLNDKDAAKMQAILRSLSEHGDKLGAPFSKPLGDGIFELRTSNRGRWHRILYFFIVNQTVVLSHGFTKKVNETPQREIAKAIGHRKDYKERNK